MTKKYIFSGTLSALEKTRSSHRDPQLHSKLRSITRVATKVHVILRSFACMSDTIELV